MKMILFSLSICLCFSLGFANENSSKGMVALEHSAQKNQYLYLFFYKEQNPQTLQREQMLDQTIQTLEKVQAVKINVTDPQEQPIVQKFDVRRAPMPLVLVVAPNGAITGGFPLVFTKDQLKNAIVSQGMASSLKSLQDRKLVFLAIQNNKTQSNAMALKGIEEMRQDSRFQNAIDLIFIDPSDAREIPFLKQFDVAPNITQANTVFLAPPGDKIGKYIGATHKEQLVRDLQNAISPCCPGGCCPGGCCPGGCCGN